MGPPARDTRVLPLKIFVTSIMLSTTYCLGMAATCNSVRCRRQYTLCQQGTIQLQQSASGLHETRPSPWIAGLSTCSKEVVAEYIEPGGTASTFADLSTQVSDFFRMAQSWLQYAIKLFQEVNQVSKLEVATVLLETCRDLSVQTHATVSTRSNNSN